MDIEIVELEMEIEILQLEIEIYELENEKIEVFINPIECKKCFKLFSAKTTLKLHKNIEHGDNSVNEQEIDTVYYVSNPIQCNICSKTFSARTTLLLHKDIIHGVLNSGKSIQTGESCRKLNTCDIFWKKFLIKYTAFNHSKSRKEYTKEHYRTHGSERFVKKCSIEKVEEDSCDVALAYEDKRFWGHKLVSFQSPAGWKMSISKRKDEQNFIFQVF